MEAYNNILVWLKTQICGNLLQKHSLLASKFPPHFFSDSFIRVPSSITSCIADPIIWSTNIELQPRYLKSSQVSKIIQVFSDWDCTILCYCCSVTKLCPTLCDPMDCSMQGSSVFHYLLKFAQIHVHCIRDAIQPSYPLPPPLFLLPSTFHSIRVFP